MPAPTLSDAGAWVLMAQHHRYPITRVCLRTGTLTLPINLLGVFPALGDITVRDSQDAEFVWRVDGRRVYGVGPFFEKHNLTPNDEITIAVDDNGRYRVAPLTRPKGQAPTTPDLAKVLDAVYQHGLALSEAEIRTRHPGIPTGPELRQALAAEPRLAYHAGRWQRRESAATAAATAAGTAPAVPTATAPGTAPAVPTATAAAPGTADMPATAAQPQASAHQESREAEQAKRREAARLAALEAEERRVADARRREVEATLQAQEERERHIKALVDADEFALEFGRVESVADLADLPDVQRASRERLAAHAQADAMAEARRQRDARAEAEREMRRGDGVDTGNELEMFAWDQPLVRRLRFPWLKRRDSGSKNEAPRVLDDPLKLDRLGEPRPVRRDSETATRVQPLVRPNLFGAPGVAPQELSAGDPASSRRAREAFTALGFRVEGLANGQLMLHVDYGRRKERILVHVMVAGEGLPWGPLLDRRRMATASQLAVVGDQRDLHREVAPAELAKATLWSWAGLERVVEIAQTVPLGPIDLVEHFERDGMAEYGLERFERSIQRRLQERAALSGVLESLARMRVPSMFMVEDVVTGLELPRDQAVRALEQLCEAPWHLVARVDSGEFCLRYRVADALAGVGTYVQSLGERLPSRDRDVLQSLPLDADPIDVADVEGERVAVGRRKAKTLAVARTEEAAPAAEGGAEAKARVAQEPLIKLS